MKLKLHSLPEAVEAVNRYCEQQDIPPESCNRVHLVCEELIVNLLSYSDSENFNLSLNPVGKSTEIIISYQGEKFNPVVSRKPEQKSVEDMQFGGLGLVLVNSLATKIEYLYHQKQSENVIKVIL